jgi:voltage-gated potassium channel Kch
MARSFDAFMRRPLSMRKAIGVTVAATLTSVVVGGGLMAVVDPEFPDLGTGLWWALQTVTTVGYGDVTPAHTAGRLVGAMFMLEAIAFVAIVTAAITSSFVERARRERGAEAAAVDVIGVERLTAELSAVNARPERIERSLKLGD